MSLRHEYIRFKEERLDMPFDEDAEMEFMEQKFGPTIGTYTRKLFAELLEIEKRLDYLEQE